MLLYLLWIKSKASSLDRVMFCSLQEDGRRDWLCFTKRAAYLNFKKYIHIQIYQYLCVNTPDVGVSEPLYNLDGRISTLQQVMQPYNYIWLVLPLTFHQMSWTYKNTNQHYISRKCKRKKKTTTKLLSPRIIKLLFQSTRWCCWWFFPPCLLHN